MGLTMRTRTSPTCAETVIHFSLTSIMSIGRLDIVEDLPSPVRPELVKERWLGRRVHELLRSRFEGLFVFSCRVRVTSFGLRRGGVLHRHDSA